MARVRINITLSPECVTDLKFLAKERRVSVSALVDRLVYDAMRGERVLRNVSEMLDNMNDKEDEKKND